jgi:CMP-N-acetylneuraminic acid synthetase
MKQLRVLALITARGGSKSIPKKNIKELQGKPLIAYTIEAAKRAKLLTRTIVSTDSEEIATIARTYGADVPFLRPADISGDKSTSLEAAQHALEFLKARGEEYDYLLILQPTSPLRTATDIDACIRVALETGADSVMGMVELPDFSLKKLKRVDSDGRITPLLADEGKHSGMRQEGEKVYKRNAALYLTRVPCIMKGDLFGDDSRSYSMPQERSVDINDPADFDLAAFYLTKRT